MIVKIRNSRSFKGISMLLALSILFELTYPTQSWALTGGPSQPEFSSFTPVGTSDMVDLSSGDMSYNIPLMDVGGYPINLAYSSGVGMDDEASWVGLGWNLSVGQISHNVRGISDDFNGDQIQYENYMRPNFTVGANIKVESAAFGVPIDLGQTVSTVINAAGEPESTDDDMSFGLAMTYNNYNGFTVKPSVGINVDLKQNVSVGFNAESGPDGLTLSPTVSLHSRNKETKERNNNLSSTIGASMNSRQGLTSATLNMKGKQQTNVRAMSEKAKGANRSMSLGSSIGFTDQLYTPSNRVGMRTYTLTFNGTALPGAEFFGIEGQTQIGAYATIMSVAKKNQNKKSPSYGYSHTESAGVDGILDFNREKDGSVSQNTTNLPITNYTYDIHSVQGQGVSGMYRAFRSQVGYVYDARVVDVSASGALGLEYGVGSVAHTGVDFEGTGVVSYSGKWENKNDMLPWLEASTVNPEPDYETVSYKNVGDLSSDRDFNTMFSDQGNYQATRVGFWSSKPINFNRRANSGFKKKINGEGNETYDQLGNTINRNKRQLRNQAIVNVTVGELNKGVGYGPAVTRNGTSEYGLPSEAKSHHVGEVQILRNDGARYIYGIPAYNTTKREATFAVAADGNCTTGIVDFSAANLADLSNPESLPNDQFLERITTPGYAHSHLLTSILSTDYVDRTNDGPSADDYGSYTKFSYKKYSEINPGQELYRWRVPYEGASYSEGLKSDDQDDRGNYVYGEKEILLIDMISTKTHVAKFFYSERKDAHGVAGEQGGYDANMKSYKLDEVKLYSIEEYYDVDASGVQVVASNPTPIKTAHFVYDYSLCQNVPNNPVVGTLSSNELSNELGKLTLKQVYFTYRNSKMGEYTKYKFSYNTLNPDYNIKGYDYWGNYKPNPNGCANTDDINASEYPYTDQDGNVQNERASAWSLTDIELPSGGKISVEYESDDYGFVQDKETMRMFKVIGAGNDRNPDGDLNLNDSEELFGNQLVNKAKRYLYVQVDDDPSFTEGDYIDRLKKEKIQFRFLMNMTPMGNDPTKLNEAKYDYVSGYFEYEDDNSSSSTNTSGYNGSEFLTAPFDHDSDPSTSDIRVLSIPVRVVDKEGGLTGSTGLTNKVHPISKATWHFGRKYLNKHVYSPLPNGDISTPQNPVVGQVGQLVVDLLSPQMINNLIEIFTGPNATLENKNIGRRFIKEKSWVRLDNPRSYKLGGGCRVSKVKMSDVWSQMTNAQGSYQTMNYGQQYSYTLKDGVTTSGVATYEPVGNKENPFVQPVFSDEKKLLAPDEQNFVEMPFGESFFPSPQVTYSRVSVSNITAGATPPSGFTDPVLKKLHRTGKVVTEFYTSKDYPTIVDQTILMAREDKIDALANILKINVKRHFTGTQGYVIHLNDMNGKQKAQWVYAEGQDAPISGVEYKYDGYTTPNQFSAASDPERNKGRLNNEVVVIRPNGEVGKGTIGVEVDMVNDFRENKTTTITAGVNMNLATIFVGLGILAAPMPLPDFSNSEDQFRSASTTKVINTFGILRETIAHDAGATVSTRNLAWDEITGEVLLTETVDEYSDRYYTFNYPAHWHYDGMGQAAQNIAYTSEVVGNGSGDYTVSNVGTSTAEDFLIAGDEVYFIPSDASTVSSYKMGWITNITGNTISIIDENGIAIDAPGYPHEGIKVIRSGRRNLQSAGIMNVTLMKNPLLDGSGILINDLGPNFLIAAQGNWEDWRIINAGAVDYSQEWFVGCECGVGEGSTNPYRINEKGVWRTRSSRTYLTGRNNAPVTTGRQEGFFTSFAPMYRNVNADWTKNFSGWTYVAEVTQFSPYGFELENVDALNRYSAAQYGYNNTFPMAVGANTRYQEIGYDGFEDYNFKGCESSEHFKFPSEVGQNGQTTNPSTGKAHTGRYSLRVGPNSRKTMDKKLDCDPLPSGELDGEASTGGSNE